MKSTLVVIALLLAGCSSYVPVKQKFPAAPATAQQACPKLDQVPPNAQLSDVAKTVNSNYQHYWNCALKVEAWQEWYKSQKAIFEEANK